MPSERYEVVVVLDREFGDRIDSLLQSGPVWIIDTPINRIAAEMYWELNSTSSHLDGVTTFKALGSSSPEDALIAELYTIDLHHGEYSARVPYTSLRVIGAQRTDAVDAALVELGLHHFAETEDGFRASRA